VSNLLNSSNLDTRRGMVARTSFADITICISPRDYVNRTNYDIFKIIQDIVAENRLKLFFSISSGRTKSNFPYKNERVADNFTDFCDSFSLGENGYLGVRQNLRKDFSIFLDDILRVNALENILLLELDNKCLNCKFNSHLFTYMSIKTKS